MEVSFNWHRYSVAFSFLKNENGNAKVQEMRGFGQGKSVLGDDLFAAADSVKRELMSGLCALAVKKPGRRELLNYLHQLLKPYTQLRVPEAYAFRIAINNAIERNAEEYCSIRLTRQDLSLLWQDEE
jgi:hypothetical protein